MTLIVSLASMLVLGQTAAKEPAVVSFDCQVVVWRNAVTNDGRWPAHFVVLNTGNTAVKLPSWPANYDLSPDEARWCHRHGVVARYPEDYVEVERGDAAVFPIAIPRQKEYSDQQFRVLVSVDAYVRGEKRPICLEAVTSKSQSRHQAGKVSGEKPVEQPSKGASK